MLERGGFSFVALLVINPALILFFQNCALVPHADTKTVARSRPMIQRSISSVQQSSLIPAGNSLRMKTSRLETCDSADGNCTSTKTK